MKSICLLVCLFVSFFCILHLHADEDILTMESGEVCYQGSTLALTEGVVVEHALGRLIAQEMLFTPLPGGNKMRLGTLDMTKHIQLQLKEGGQLTCGKAHLDAQTSEGQFEGDEEDPFVSYMENGSGKAGENRLPLVVKSRRMHVWIDKAPPENAPKSYFKQIEADEQVTFDYNHDFIAQADKGCYQRTGAGLASLIHLQAKESEGECRVTNRMGDLIQAKEIAVDTEKRRITFSVPHGAFYTVRGEEAPERLDFSGDTLIWEDCENAFYLRGNVQLRQKGIGTLTNAEEFKVTQCVVGKKKQLASIQSTGKSVLNHADHTLTCYGKAFVDHLRLTVTLDSPAEGPQVFFEDSQGQISADHVVLNYAIVNKGIVAQTILLEGHVKMENTQAQALQYALADKVEYTPANLQMLLTANKGKRVLFYDKSNNLEVSAPGIKIKRDPITQKDAIKGIGDVRFSLIEHEFEQLREKFSIGRKKAGEEEL